MIRSFSDKETEKIFNREVSRRFSNDIQQTARRTLRNSECRRKFTGFARSAIESLEKLRGNRKNQHSIRINNQWRICFVWQGSDVFEVEIVDYH